MNGRLQRQRFTALKFSIVSELTNAILFLKAKMLPEQISQPSARPPNPCATGFCRKTTGTYGSSTRNYRVKAILLSTSFPFDAQEVLSPLHARAALKGRRNVLLYCQGFLTGHSKY